MKNVVITGSTRGVGSNDMIIEQTILYGTSKGALIINISFFSCFIGYKLIYKNIISENYYK